MEQTAKAIAKGTLLMNGATAEWPPRDMAGVAVSIGCVVRAVRDTTNVQGPHSFVVGGLRLQNVGGELRWVVCAYDDSRPLYVESYAEDCVVAKAAPRC